MNYNYPTILSRFTLTPYAILLWHVLLIYSFPLPLPHILALFCVLPIPPPSSSSSRSLAYILSIKRLVKSVAYRICWRISLLPLLKLPLILPPILNFIRSYSLLSDLTVLMMNLFALEYASIDGSPFGTVCTFISRLYTSIHPFYFTLINVLIPTLSLPYFYPYSSLILVILLLINGVSLQILITARSSTICMQICGLWINYVKWEAWMDSLSDHMLERWVIFLPFSPLLFLFFLL